jgi:hypothetical protein
VRKGSLTVCSSSYTFFTRSWSLSSSSSCNLCPAGTSSPIVGGNSNSTCVGCFAGSYSQSGSASCSLCPGGTSSAIVNSSSYSCQDCAPGTFSLTAGSAICSNCSAGFFSNLPKSTSCIPCQQGTYQASSGQTQCLNCPNGTTNPLIGQSTCSLCLPGRYPQTATSGCILCPAGTTSRTGDSSCTTCPLGLVAVLPGSPACVSCPVGQSSDNPTGPCQPCTQVGYFVDPFSGLCQPCAAGTYSTLTGCIPCTPGLFSRSASSSCSPCPLGSIGTNPASGACNPCATGTVRSDPYQLTCNICLPGTYAADPSIACQPCPTGSEQPNAGQSSCNNCSLGRVAPSPGTATCFPCYFGEYAKNASTPCFPCPTGFFSNQTGSLQCSACGTSLLCPLASKFGVMSSSIPFFSQLGLVRAAVASTPVTQSFSTDVLLPPNYWTTPNGITAIVVMCSIFLVLPAVIVGVYCAMRKQSSDFSSMKENLTKADLLYSTAHKNGPLPKAMVERQTVFGAFMGFLVVLGFCVLATFLILNWYYSPSLSSSVIPFGYVGEPDPEGNFSIAFDLWGWTGNCTCNSNQFAFNGIGQAGSSSWSITCTSTVSSCSISLSAPRAVISSLGSIGLAMPQGNCMGLTYTSTLTPSLNVSAIQLVTQSVFAGSSDVFGGPVPLIVSLGTTWSKLRDDTKGTKSSGWIMSAAGMTPGSTLNNVTYLTATDKQFRAQILLSRGTTFLAITITYTTQFAILLGSILGYFSGLMSLGRTVMRIVEAVHQKDRTPPSVEAYLTNVGGSKNNTSAISARNAALTDTFDVENDDAPQVTKVSAYDRNRI